jgi:hypothetical protein
MNIQTPPRHSRWIIALVALLAASLAFAADGDKSNIKGLITAVHGDTLTVRDSNNADQTITVTPTTVYKKTKGLTNVIHEKVTQSSLLPGLPISADVVARGAGFEATQINFSRRTSRPRSRCRRAWRRRRSA